MSDHSITPDVQLRQVQLACFEILKKFKQICEKHNLRYYLAYGTLLGAIRHQGYIPWDDDIDVWMPRPDLERFLSIAQEELTEHHVMNYYSIPNNAAFPYRTQLCIEDHRYRVGFQVGNTIKSGYIWIDIMAMDGMPKSALSQKLQCSRFYFWYAVVGLARSSRIGIANPKTRSKMKMIVNRIDHVLGIGKHLDIVKCFDGFKKAKMRYEFDKCEYVHGSTSYYVEKAIFPRVFFEGVRTATFEGEVFSIPFMAEKVLSSIYGEYMKLPPEEKRVRGHFAVIEPMSEVEKDV